MTLYYSEPFKIEIKGRSVFVNEEVKEFSVRNLSDLNDVLIKKQQILHDFPIYFMFRSIAQKNGLRYDITLIPSRNIVGEYAKTYGHYHSIAEKNLSYPELYQVLNGKALFVLQKKRRDESVECIITYGEKGQVLFIPPNYGHITINATEDTLLVVGNLVSHACSSIYEEYKENRGGAYYITEHGVEQNNNYILRTTEKINAEKINERYGIQCKDLLKEFWENPKRFEFLTKPSIIIKKRFNF